MEENRQQTDSHAKAPRRKGAGIFAPLRLCARFLSNAAVVLCLALCVRCGTLWLTPDALMNDPDGYLRLATGLVDDRTFGHGDTPTAYRPPLYPVVLSGCVLLGNHDRASVVLAISLLHVLLGTATVGMVWLLARWWGLGRGAAAIAAILVACDPILLASSSLVMTETLATFLTTLGLLALTWTERRRAEWARRFISLTAAGVVLGLAALCRPAFLLWTLAAVVVLWWRDFRRPIGGSRIAGSLCAPAAFALGAVVVLSPWVIRNQLQFGRPIVTTTHGGYTMLLANNPEFYDWLRSGSWGSVWEADEFNCNWDMRRSGDELQDDHQAYTEAWQTIRDQPGMFLYACTVRMGRFWSPLPHHVTATETPWAVRHLLELRLGPLPDRVAAEERPLHRLSRYAVALWYIGEFLLAILGVWQVSRSSPRPLGDGSGVRAAVTAESALTLTLSQRERGQFSPVALLLPSSAWLWGFLLVGCLMAGHLVYWTDMRMRAPIMPVVAIFAASGLLYGEKCHSCLPKK
jgi:4-amino-4-deoxy-L-arabinose transferase-like glycosyltransferase